MSKLHVINRTAALADCLALLAPGDGVLLCGDAVLQWQLVLDDLQGSRLHVLAEDLQARGLQTEDAISCVDYEGFVELCCAHEQVLAW